MIDHQHWYDKARQNLSDFQPGQFQRPAFVDTQKSHGDMGHHGADQYKTAQGCAPNLHKDVVGDPKCIEGNQTKGVIQ